MTLLNEPGSIAEGQRGHRRGVVLGFTMAELMLLLLFCLLLVSAGILLTKDEEIERQQDEITRLKDLPNGNISNGELELLLSAKLNLEALLSLLFPDGIPELSAAEIDALWTEVVLAKDARGKLAEAARDANGGTALTPEQLNALIRALEALIASGLTSLTPEQFKLLTAWLAGPSGQIDQDRLFQLNKLLQVLEAAGGKALPPERLAAAIELARDPSFNPNSSGHRWPPMISLADDGNRFEIGSAEITAAFRESLQETTAKQVADLLPQFQADVVEIIGHTDEQRMGTTDASNLDEEAITVMLGDASSEILRPVDNAGLGLARAIAVARVLRATKLFGPNIKIVPLSAAQLLQPGDQLSDGTGTPNDSSRRRIEIRVRRSTEQLQ